MAQRDDESNEHEGRDPADADREVGEDEEDEDDDGDDGDEEEEEEDEGEPTMRTGAGVTISDAPHKPAAPAAKQKSLFDSPWTYLLFIPALLVVWLVMSQSRQNAEKAEVAPLASTVSEHPLTDADMPALASAIAAAWADRSVDRSGLPARLAEPGQAVYVVFRAGGEQLESLWVYPEQLPEAGTMWDVVTEALKTGKARLGSRADTVTRIEMNLTHTYRSLDGKKQIKQIVDEDVQKVPKHHGVRGMRIKHGERSKQWAPTWQIAVNKTNSELVADTRKQWKLSEQEFAQAEFSSFEADQVLVRLDREPVDAVLMFRGNRIVDVDEVTQASTEVLAQGMKSWLVNNLHPDGRLTYMFWPSKNEEDRGNNQIRQWMATNAMIRWAHDRNDPALFDRVEQNIDHNVAKFYEQEGELGLIVEGKTKVKLGAVALAGMAMYTHPKREKWATQIAGLRKMVDHLWHEDGSFSSFYRGGDKEYWNFYPGEALLFWATIYAQEKDPEILRKYKQSFAFFRDWHREHRNPAFVPWHLQANYTLWSALGDDEAEFKQELVDFSFEIADWLVTVQAWDAERGEITYPDEAGRFYTSEKKFGVPHASSTGVYIEGLIDAWQFARDLGDADRREKYRISLLRGIRSMMQLQFVDDVDMFYVEDPKYVVGGIRTSEYRNEIRCDNVQHPLMGIIKVLRMFEASEYGGAG